MLSIELTLKYNHVTGVYSDRLTSAGQLIPLCIGALGIVKALFDRWITRSKKKRMKAAPWEGACERCQHRGWPCSSSITRCVEFAKGRRDRNGNNVELRKALFAAWLPWLMVYLYDPVEEA